MTDSIESARRAYAEELWFTTHMRSQALRAAFAAVPRERFVGPGPWIFKTNWENFAGWTTADDDPRQVYHDVLIALDEKLGLNNGLPAFWAFLLDRINVASGESVTHLGCGTGYYTAILAELVGPTGKIRAIDIHPDIAARAREALAPWPQVQVEHADGSKIALEPADLIVVNAGATHPMPAWLAAVKPGGRILIPITVTNGPGSMVLLTRRSDEEFGVRVLSNVFIYEFSGARDPEVNERLRQAMTNSRGHEVKSVRTDSHAEDETCWLHGDGWCLSRRDPERATR